MNNEPSSCSLLPIAGQEQPQCADEDDGEREPPRCVHDGAGCWRDNGNGMHSGCVWWAPAAHPGLLVPPLTTHGPYLEAANPNPNMANALGLAW